ncbi:MAG: hypothetical protein HKM95_12190 [Inquilinus sp.]|nr:hypothetical protein [Inquilinus sp.]
MSKLNWRSVLLAAIPVAALTALFSLQPIGQPPEYHLFADRRGCLGIPNFGDVASNSAFLAAGVLGLHRCLIGRPEGARLAWIVFFAGAGLVSVGSAYYHWQPDNRTLVWDRLPMTIGFMGAYVALLAEYADRRLELVLIPPAVTIGLASVFYWDLYDDLRPYFAVQATVIATIVAVILAFAHPPRQRGYLIAALGSYALAIVCEQLDQQIFDALGGLASGHTIKHLLAAFAVFVIAWMLHARPSTRLRSAKAGA